MLLNTRLHLFLAILFAAFMVSRNGSFWPVVWPDEALFSSPASSLAVDGVFRTPVLEGLVPGMDQATLWNSPLYILLLSFVYLFTGEALQVGRTLSFVLGIGVLLVLRDFISMITRKKIVRVLALWGMALDLTYLRAMNTIRMDILALLFILLTVKILYKNASERNREADFSSAEVRMFYLAGIYTGLAAMSHPFSVILLPIWVILVFPRWKGMGIGLFGALSSLIPWLAYVLSYPKIFAVQFLSQIGRKLSFLGFSPRSDSLAQLDAHEPGWVLKVFSSQYGENGALFMGVFLFLFFGILLVSGFFILRNRNERKSQGTFRQYLVTLSVIGMILLSSEMWYAVYAVPFLILAVLQTDKQNRISWIETFLLAPLLLFFVVSLYQFEKRNHSEVNRAQKVEDFQISILGDLKECNTVFLRSRPDPYFRIRQAYPNITLLEFIPGRLRFSSEEEDRINHTLRGVDCFVLDANDGASPYLSSFLKDRLLDYSETRTVAINGMEPVRILRRTKNEPGH